MADGHPVHDVKVYPAAGVAMRLTSEPEAPVAEQVVEQLEDWPPMVPEIVPPLAGVTARFSTYCWVEAANVAVTAWGPVIVTVVEALAELATLPVQPLKTKPEFAAACKFTAVPEL